MNRTSTKRLFPAGAIIDEVVSAITRLVDSLRDSKTIALLLFSCLLVYLVIVPLAVLVFGSFKAVAPGTQDYFLSLIHI